MTAHTLSLPARDRWLPWVGLAAFVIMALTVITQSGLPPFPRSTATWAFVVIIGCLIIALVCLTVFISDVLTRDAEEGTAERRGAAARSSAGAEASPGAQAQVAR